MTAKQVGSYSFKLSEVTFIIERHDMETFPGYESEVVVVDYLVTKKASQAGICSEKQSFKI